MAIVTNVEARTTGVSADTPATRSRWTRWESLTGLGFVVLFVAGLLSTTSLQDNDPNSRWLQDYASRGNQVRILVAGFLVVLASLCLIAFVASMWSRIAQARRPEATSPLPLVAGGIGAAGIALGGVFAASVPGAMIFGHLRLPGADILRLTMDLFFPAVTIAGMFGVALAIAGLAVQAHRAGLFSRRFAVVGVVVGVLTLSSFMFLPMAVPVIWFLIVSIILLRRQGGDACNARLSCQATTSNWSTNGQEPMTRSQAGT